MDWTKPWLIAHFMVSYLCDWYLDGILFCLPIAAHQDAGSSINSWADQAWGEIKTTESPRNISNMFGVELTKS